MNAAKRCGEVLAAREAIVGVLMLSGCGGAEAETTLGGSSTASESEADPTYATSTTTSDTSSEATGVTPTSSSSTETGATATICDSSTNVRLVLTDFVHLPLDETRNAAQAIMYENGYTYYYVTGTCEFRAQIGDQHVFAPDLIGVLSPADAEELAADLRYADWSDYYDTTPGVNPMGGNPALIDEGGMFMIGSSCFPDAQDPSDCPAPFPEVAAGVEEWRTRLQALGTPADGPMRVAAVLEEPPGVVTEGIEWSPWPLARPISDFVLDSEVPIEPGHGVALVDPDEIETMRAFREAFVSQFKLEDTIRGMYVVAEGQHYLVYARDAASVEDANGLVPWLHSFEPSQE